MNFGKVIKFHRVKKGLTQEELVTGLISISYLSKIENGLSKVSPDIIEEIFLRLGIQHTIVNEIELNEEIKSWYQLIINNNLEKSKEVYYELIKIKNSSSFYTNSLFSLVSIRYFLTLGKLDEAKKIINELSGVKKEFSNELLFYFYKFKGTFEYLNNNFAEAYNSYKQAESLFDSTILPLERADVFYSLGMVTTQLLKPYLAIYYTKQALELFRDQYVLHRCSDCHLLLGILFIRSKEYDEAASHYQWASKLAKEVNHQSLFGIIEHNIGYLYYIQGQYTTALQYYERSVNIKGTESSKLNTIICIMKIYYKQNNEEKLISWLAAGEPYISYVSSKDSVLFHEYQIFRHLARKEYEDFIYYTTKVALPFFEKQGSYPNSSYYSGLIAEYFKEKRKYKQSSYYFEYCKKILNKKL
ncbi:helix-turn-helix transcriptional regulator [Psychrobacillus sp. INOP01]|uniref:helix-turn-helix transcriptional regulator n=1 Tax=Psychrobacillus sp. INOP01 TaxID=2829187 RepID=UPI001BA7B685|nr:helix-turn-helix transcriptional regulator [Psychrobacillus sp. INOP01]QUG43129.1 helix-turn-helix transcriptional regulator [Psychrobacillus sp. INOP01]